MTYEFFHFCRAQINSLRGSRKIRVGIFSRHANLKYKNWKNTFSVRGFKEFSEKNNLGIVIAAVIVYYVNHLGIKTKYFVR